MGVWFVWLVGWLVEWLGDWLVGLLIGWFFCLFVCLFVCLFGWLFGLVGLLVWLVDWLVINSGCHWVSDNAVTSRSVISCVCVCFFFESQQGHTYSPVQWVTGFFPRAEVDHSSPYTAAIKNEWSCTSTLPACCHGVEKGKRTFTFHMCVCVFSDTFVMTKGHSACYTCSIISGMTEEKVPLNMVYTYVASSRCPQAHYCKDILITIHFFRFIILTEKDVSTLFYLSRCF